MIPLAFLYMFRYLGSTPWTWRAFSILEVMMESNAFLWSMKPIARCAYSFDTIFGHSGTCYTFARRTAANNMALSNSNREDGTYVFFRDTPSTTRLKNSFFFIAMTWLKYFNAYITLIYITLIYNTLIYIKY